MIWFILSLPLAFGVALVFMGWSGENVLPPEIIASIGGIIIFGTIWIGYRYYLQDKHDKVNIVLRPDRLKVKSEIIEFIDYCIRFKTEHHMMMIPNTRALSNKRTQFNRFIEKKRPLQIKNLNEKLKDINSNAVRLQRLLDRQGHPGISGQKRMEIEDKIDSTIDWFIDMRQGITSFLNKLIALD